MSPRQPLSDSHLVRLGLVALAGVLLVGGLVACGGPAASTTGSDISPDGKVGIVEKLGDTIPEGLMFKDEDGNDVELRSLLRQPTVLTLVYLRCPSICGELINELGRTVDELQKLQPGRDYDLVTVSFDPREGPELAKTGKTEFLKRVKTDVPPDAWRFLTGDQENITKLTQAVGFLYTEDKQDFKHAGAVIFLSKEGKIVRYLGGLEMLPFHMELAINDAREGNARSFMQKIQRLCYSYDPEGKTYALQVNRIILLVTLLGAGIFLFGVVLKRRRKGTA
ncbi:MAG: SCO family protein [Planctomycetota bacterium]|nr:SCO family protein [Planctomycetota bacterium]